MGPRLAGPADEQCSVATMTCDGDLNAVCTGKSVYESVFNHSSHKPVFGDVMWLLTGIHEGSYFRKGFHFNNVIHLI